MSGSSLLNEEEKKIWKINPRQEVLEIEQERNEERKNKSEENGGS